MHKILTVTLAAAGVIAASQFASAFTPNPPGGQTALETSQIVLARNGGGPGHGGMGAGRGGMGPGHGGFGMSRGGMGLGHGGFGMNRGGMGLGHGGFGMGHRGFAMSRPAGRPYAGHPQSFAPRHFRSPGYYGGAGGRYYMGYPQKFARHHFHRPAYHHGRFKHRGYYGIGLGYGYPYWGYSYGWDGGSCYWNCRAAGYGPRFCRTQAWRYC